MKKPSASEFQEQKTLLEWASYFVLDSMPYPCRVSDYLIHIPNGGSRNPIEARRLKEAGVKAGVSDLFLAIPNKLYNGLWIEMKRRKGGQPTPQQVEWIGRMERIGYRADICYGWEEAKNVILEYLST